MEKTARGPGRRPRRHRQQSEPAHAGRRKLGLRDIAWHVLNQTPEQHKLTQSENAQTAHEPSDRAIAPDGAALAATSNRCSMSGSSRHTRSAVDRFADTHPRLDELGDLIEQELKSRLQPRQAYRRAELLKAGHARGSDPHHNGSDPYQPTDHPWRARSAPLNGRERAQGKPASRRDAIANAHASARSV